MTLKCFFFHHLLQHFYLLKTKQGFSRREMHTSICRNARPSQPCNGTPSIYCVCTSAVALLTLQGTARLSSPTKLCSTQAQGQATISWSCLKSTPPSQSLCLRRESVYPFSNCNSPKADEYCGASNTFLNKSQSPTC